MVTARVRLPMVRPDMRAAPILFRPIVATAVTVLALLVVCATTSRAQFTYPTFTNYVVDQANVIPPADEQALIAKLKAFQDKSGKQVAVATVTSLQGTSVEDYGNRLFREWKLGDKERNDGALLLVAPNDRKVRIEVGYGLEGDLTDAVSRLIIENAILPRFKAGDFPGGISRGVDDMMAVFSGQAEDYKQRAAQQAEEEEPPLIMTIFMICFWLFFLYVLWRSFRSAGQGGVSRRRHGPWIIGGPGYGGGFGGGGGGWSGGGGGGGFGGGGGGSSGGGGASGGW